MATPSKPHRGGNGRKVCAYTPHRNAEPAARGRGPLVWAKRCGFAYAPPRLKVLSQTLAVKSPHGNRESQTAKVNRRMIYDMIRKPVKPQSCAQAPKIDQTIDHGLSSGRCWDAIPIYKRNKINRKRGPETDSTQSL